MSGLRGESTLWTNSVYLKDLNLEDHVLFAPSRLRDREASFWPNIGA